MAEAAASHSPSSSFIILNNPIQWHVLRAPRRAAQNGPGAADHAAGVCRMGAQILLSQPTPILIASATIRGSAPICESSNGGGSATEPCSDAGSGKPGSNPGGATPRPGSCGQGPARRVTSVPCPPGHDSMASVWNERARQRQARDRLGCELDPELPRRSGCPKAPRGQEEADGDDAREDQRRDEEMAPTQEGDRHEGESQSPAYNA